MSTQKLNAETLKENANAGWAAVHVFDTIGSTNSWVKEQGEPFIACLAEAQTQGRGRNGNPWRSPDAENIYLSYSWRFESAPNFLPLLSLWVGIAVAESLGSLGINQQGIKWPNDLYWQQKKLGGILIETSSASSDVIVGLGINANVSMLDDIDQPWTSLSEACGQAIDREALVVVLLNSLHRAMEAFPALTAAELQSRWKQWDLIRGKAVTFQQAGEILEGQALGIDEQGCLLVKAESGQITAFNTSIQKVRWQ